jgi:general secretion pathway protein G
MNSNTSLKQMRGFSLIEIVVVVTLIGLIMGWAVTRIFGQGEAAKAKIAKSQMQDVIGALDLYKLDTGKFPTGQEGLKALMQAPSGVVNWNGPYVRKAEQLKDAWNNDWIYRSPGTDGRPFEIVSLGADGKEGGEGADRDIKSWE